MGKCDYKVINPKTKESTESLLYLALEKKYPELGKASRIYEKWKNSSFIYSGSIKKYLKSIKGDLYDENGEILAEHVINYEERVFVKRNVEQPLGGIKLSTNKWATKSKEMAVSLSKRIAFYKNKKFASREQSKIQRLIDELLLIKTETDFLKGLENFIVNTSEQFSDLIDKIGDGTLEDMKKLSDIDMHDMHNIIQTYRNLDSLLQDAIKETERIEKGTKVKGILDVTKPMIERLRTLTNDYSKITGAYETLSMHLLVSFLPGNEHIEALREETRKIYFIQEPEESKQKAEETDDQYNTRIQNTIEDIIVKTNMYDEEDRRAFFESLLRAGDDISWISRMALQAGNTSSTLLRSLNILFRKSEHTARLLQISKMAELNPLFQEYKEYMEGEGKNVNNTKELYALINELDSKGNATGYYVGKRKSVWQKERIQLETYIRDYEQHLQKKESENNEEEYKFWDIELNEPKREEDKKRLKKLKRAARGNINKTYTETDKILKAQLDKISKESEKISEKYKEFRRKVKSQRKIKDISSNAYTEIGVELNILREEISDIRDTINGLEKEAHMYLFKNYYDEYRLPAVAALKNIEAQDEVNLQTGKYVSGETRGEPEDFYKIKILPDLTIEDYNSPQFEKLQRLREEDVDNIQWKYYKAIMTTVVESENQYPETYRTFFKLPEIAKTGAERFEEDVNILKDPVSIFRAYIKPTLIEKTMNTPGYDFDLNYENTMSNEALQKNGYRPNKATKQLPVYLKNSGIELKNQSTNIQMLAMAGYSTAVMYHEKTQILPYIEMFLYILENRGKPAASGVQKMMNVVRSSLGQTFLKTEDYFERTVDKPEYVGKSNIYKNALDEVNKRMFGELVNQTLNINIPLPGTKYQLSVMKLFRLFTMNTSTTLLSFNVKAGIANVNYGVVQHLTDTFGNEFFDKKSIGKSYLEYGRQFHQLLGDIGKDYPTSKLNLLGLIFDPQNDFNPNEHHYKYSNKIYAILNSNSLQGVNSVGEHFLHQIIMGAILQETKVLNESGEYLKKGEGTTKDRDKAMSLYEAYSKVSKGPKSYELFLDKRVAKIEIRQGTRKRRLAYKGGNIHAYKISDLDFEENGVPIRLLTNIIQGLNEQMFGPYSWVTDPPMKKTILGTLLLQMRKFFPKGIQRTWARFTNEIYTMYAAGLKGEFSQYFIDIREQSSSKRYFDYLDLAKTGEDDISLDYINQGPSAQYDPKFERIREALNPTLFRQGALLTYHLWIKVTQLFGKEYEDSKAMKTSLMSLTKEQWRTLSNNEKANIRRLVVTASMRALLTSLAALLLSGKDDDEKYYKLAFYTFRLNTELNAYYSPAEMNRLMQSPAVTLSMLQRYINVYDQLIEDLYNGEFEVYQSGSRKGTTKIGKALRAALPWGNVMQQHKYIEDVLNYHLKASTGIVKK